MVAAVRPRGHRSQVAEADAAAVVAAATSRLVFLRSRRGCYGVPKMKKSRQSRVGNERKGPLNARFEIDGKMFVTDRATLDVLNRKHHYSPRVAGWHFAINLAT